MKTNKALTSILHVTDLHLFPHKNRTLLGVDTEYYFKEVLENAYQRYGKFDLILVSGDLAQEACIESYTRLRDILLSYKTATVCLPGNHDDYTLMKQVFNQEKLNCHKQTFFKNWQLICLNSQKINQPGGAFSEEELTFLKTSLAQNKQKHIIISAHHHCVLSGSKWMDTMVIENRAEFFDCLAPYPEIKLIVTGHVHQVLDVQKQGIRVMSTPATCFQFKPTCEKFTLDTLLAPAYRVLQLAADGGIETKVHYLPEKPKVLKTIKDGY
jgi:Icc protein